MQVGQDAAVAHGVVNDAALGQLEGEQFTGDAVALQCAADAGHQVGLDQAVHREVHRDRQGDVLVQPAPAAGQREIQDVVGDRTDPADLLGQVDEVVRRDGAVARVGPAHQRLDRDDVGGLGVDDRLEDDADLAVGHRLLELGAELQAAEALLVEHGVVTGHPAGVGGGEQRHVGPLHQRAGVGAVHRGGGEADRQGHLEIQPGDP